MRKQSQSAPIRPLVPKTRGVKDPISTSIIMMMMMAMIMIVIMIMMMMMMIIIIIIIMMMMMMMMIRRALWMQGLPSINIVLIKRFNKSVFLWCLTSVARVSTSTVPM